MNRSSGDKPSATRTDFEQLLLAARQGDAAAIGCLLEQHRERLRGIAQERLPDHLHAKLSASDVVQQTYLDIHQRFPAFKGESRPSFIAWLRTSLLNHLRDEVRRFRSRRRQSQREVPIEFDSDAPQALHDLMTPSRDAAVREEQEQLWQAIQSLSDPHRQVILLRHQQGLSFASIGERLGVTENAARKQWVRAVTTLQSALKRAKER